MLLEGHLTPMRFHLGQGPARLATLQEMVMVLQDLKKQHECHFVYSHIDSTAGDRALNIGETKNPKRIAGYLTENKKDGPLSRQRIYQLVRFHCDAIEVIRCTDRGIALKIQSDNTIRARPVGNSGFKHATETDRQRYGLAF